MARIELDGVHLTFRVRQNHSLTLKEWLIKRYYRESVNPIIEVKALQDVSLRVKKGERLGIIGHNGAGKSTLLKVLAGIYQPSVGRRLVEGRISSLFDIALGFEGEANGWDNIKFRSYLQGETPSTIRRKIGQIAEFSELGNFLNMPVRYYSAGMMVRLAFSIATAIEPEVLLVDEVLSAGDLNFQHKARGRMREMMSQAHLFVMVSHDLNALRTLCEQLVWMDHGRVRQIGPSEEIIAAYKVSAGLPAAAAAADDEAQAA
jgi:ABC-type polysaccharide/polyol phosphate transport system ATPase subunit